MAAEDNKMNRRDWFRLSSHRSDSQNASTSTPTGPHTNEKPVARKPAIGTNAAGLQPVEHPVNHDGMDLAKLPPMREAMLNHEEVQQLFSDISALGTNVLLMQRSAQSPRATASKATSNEQLRTARESLLSGTIPRVQIRYHWQAANWIDTLTRKNDGFNLIRIVHR